LSKRYLIGPNYRLLVDVIHHRFSLIWRQKPRLKCATVSIRSLRIIDVCQTPILASAASIAHHWCVPSGRLRDHSRKYSTEPECARFQNRRNVCSAKDRARL